MRLRTRVSVRLIQLFVGLGLLALILTRIELAELRESLADVALGSLVLGVLTGLGSRALAAVRMSLIMRRLSFQASALEILGINLKSSYLAFFLPGDLAGGAARWYLLKRSGSGGADAVVGIFFDKLNDLSTLVVMGFAASLFAGEVPGANAVRIAFAGLFASILFLQAVVLNSGFLASARRLAARLRLDRSARFRQLLDALGKSSSALHEPPLTWQARLWASSVLSHCVGIVSFLFLARSAGVEIGLVDLAWLRSAVVIIGLLPLSFAGLGVREGALIVLLSAYGVRAADAVTFSLTLFLRLILISASGGVLLALDVLRGRRVAARSDLGVLP